MKTPRIEVAEVDDEDSYLVLAGIVLVLKGKRICLETVDLEQVNKSQWNRFVTKAESYANQLNIPMVNKVEF